MTVVATTGGRVRGAVVDGLHRFRGIPYAAAPVGARRLMAPAPVVPWDGERDATVEGHTAWQPVQGITFIPEPPTPGDDCLNLNVCTPDPSASLPVLVWIHGGGFTQGCGNSSWYAGESYARDGVVAVAINYRLGAEGFAAFYGAPTNRAVLDWVAALEWVRDNIAAFGGDPSQVTIGGQSAGAAACVALMATPRAEGLFRSVIAMSGTAGNARPITATRVGATANRLAGALAVANTRDAIAKRSPNDLIAAQVAVGKERGDVPPLHYAPVAGDDVIPVLPHDAIAEGASRDIPLLLGATAQEAWIMKLGNPDADESAMQTQGDKQFRLPAARLAASRAAVGGAPVFHYDFAWATPAFGGLGAVHCVDVAFAFDCLADTHAQTMLTDAAPQSLADTMHGAFVAFVKTGNPSTAAQEWPSFDVARKATLVFNETTKVVDDLFHLEEK